VRERLIIMSERGEDTIWPFGKYSPSKGTGRSIAWTIQNDPKYVEYWRNVSSQGPEHHAMRNRSDYANFFRMLDSSFVPKRPQAFSATHDRHAPQHTPTPLHNSLQLKFNEERIQRRLLSILLDQLNEGPVANRTLEHIERETECSNGSDIRLSAQYHYQPSSSSSSSSSSHNYSNLSTSFFESISEKKEIHVFIEVKPVLDESFMTYVRQIKTDRDIFFHSHKQRTRLSSATPSNTYWVLLAGEVNLTHSSLIEVRRLFLSEKIYLMTWKEIEPLSPSNETATKTADGFTCLSGTRKNNIDFNKIKHPRLQTWKNTNQTRERGHFDPLRKSGMHLFPPVTHTSLPTRAWDKQEEDQDEEEEEKDKKKEPESSSLYDPPFFSREATIVAKKVQQKTRVEPEPEPKPEPESKPNHSPSTFGKLWNFLGWTSSSSPTPFSFHPSTPLQKHEIKDLSHVRPLFRNPPSIPTSQSNRSRTRRI
jgi:hypothetical protein